MWARIRSGLSHPSLSRGIFSECHHIPRGWSDCYYHALRAKRDSRPLDCWDLLYGCTGWVRSVPLSCGLVLQLLERVGIAYLVCFACLFPVSFIPCLHFPVHFSKTKKYVSLFIIIRNELCYHPIYNPQMKLSSVLFRKSLHLSLIGQKRIDPLW